MRSSLHLALARQARQHRQLPSPSSPTALPSQALTSCSRTTMKQRTTYLVTDADATQPDNFILNSDSLHIKSLHAAREDRLTIPHNELPPELAAVLKLAQSVTVRWSTPRAYESVDPYASRVPAGLHVLVSGSSEGYAPSPPPPFSLRTDQAVGQKTRSARLSTRRSVSMTARTPRSWMFPGARRYFMLLSRTLPPSTATWPAL